VFWGGEMKINPATQKSGGALITACFSVTEITTPVAFLPEP
jgi:hypothetical protein